MGTQTEPGACAASREATRKAPSAEGAAIIDRACLDRQKPRQPSRTTAVSTITETGIAIFWGHKELYKNTAESFWTPTSHDNPMTPITVPYRSSEHRKVGRTPAWTRDLGRTLNGSEHAAVVRVRCSF
jgi:hypothetical protein